MSKFTDALKKIEGTRSGPETRPVLTQTPQQALNSSASRHADDRRTEPRNRCFIQAKAVISSPHEESWINEARILDFSEKGLLFELDHPLSGSESLTNPDTTIRVQIILNPETLETLEVAGRVTRSLQTPKVRLGISLLHESVSFSKEIQDSLRLAV